MDKNNCLLIYIFSDFRVLEARNRLGGRVATMQIAKKNSTDAFWSWGIYCAFRLFEIHFFPSSYLDAAGGANIF